MAPRRECGYLFRMKPELRPTPSADHRSDASPSLSDRTTRRPRADRHRRQPCGSTLHRTGPTPCAPRLPQTFRRSRREEWRTRDDRLAARPPAAHPRSREPTPPLPRPTGPTLVRHGLPLNLSIVGRSSPGK
jgi:hypothetical protein